MKSQKGRLAIGRRAFLCGSAAAAGGLWVKGMAAAEPAADPWLHKAMFYTKLAGGDVKCDLCPRGCVVPDMERGYCGVRENRGGEYYTLVYGRACPPHCDPIEKKPFFHYRPGTTALSFGTAGCNLECKFCQNWNLSQFRPEQLDYGDAAHMDRSPDGLVQLAQRVGASSIAYTYNEPIVFSEYVCDSGKKAREAGLGAVMVSSGSINEKPLREICKNLTAIKIDLKAFTEDYYRKVCGGNLKPVLDTLVRLKDIGIWFEIVVLIVPTLNDSEDEMRNMCAWIRKNLGPNVPLHFSRFHPMYKLRNLPPTPLATLERAWRIGRESGIHFVYLGNVPGHEAESTYCPGCAKPVVSRYGFTVSDIAIKGGQCTHCGHAIPGVWEKT